MGDKESESHRSNGLGNLGVQTPVQTAIEVAGLTPGVYDTDNKCVKPDNLQERLSVLKREIAGKTWFSKLLDDVHSGEKKGIFAIRPGSIIITVAFATALVEFGFRGGRDLKELRETVKHLFEKEDPTEPKK